MPMTTYLTAEAEDAGARLDAFLAENLEELSRSRAQQLIEQGLVTLEGAAVKKNHRVSAGERFRAEVPEPEALELTPENIPLDIVYEDSDRYRRYLGNHADDDRSHTQNRTLREIKAAHCHDKEDACRRNHGDIDLCHNHGKVLQHPALCQDIKDNKDNYQSDDRKKRADQRDVRLSLKCFIL